MTEDAFTDRSTDGFTDLVDVVSVDVLRELCTMASPCVSVYLPTHRDRPDLSHDALVLRGLLGQALEQLIATGMPEGQAGELIAPLSALVDDRDFWANQGDGLALFADAKAQHVYRLPLSPPAFARAAAAPSLIPLLPVVTGDADFYLLAISQNRVRLFRATRDSIVELPDAPFPTSLQDMERRHRREAELQNRPEPRDHGVATFHGHGGTESSNVVAENFVLEVATGVRARIGADPTKPLLLASTSEYLPMLRATGALPTLVDGLVTGNPDEASAGDLLARAWPVVAGLAAERATERLEEATAWLGTGSGVCDPADIDRAARDARIDTLLVRPDVAGQPESQHLDAALCAALATGASVYPAERLPGDTAAVAKLRY